MWPRQLGYFCRWMAWISNLCGLARTECYSVNGNSHAETKPCQKHLQNHTVDKNTRLKKRISVVSWFPVPNARCNDRNASTSPHFRPFRPSPGWYRRKSIRHLLALSGELSILPGAINLATYIRALTKNASLGHDSHHPPPSTIIPWRLPIQTCLSNNLCITLSLLFSWAQNNRI